MSHLHRICRAPTGFVIAAFLLLAFGANGWAADVTVAWIANTETDLAGYKVYIGTASGTYGVPITISTQTTYTITGLAAGTTYYVAVTAYNTTGLESGFSNEISTTTSGTPTATSKCDIDSNGAANVIDLQIMINVIMGVQIIPTGKGDLNSDGKFDALDLQILVNVILGTRSCPI
jgi:hypothetical protein